MASISNQGIGGGSPCDASLCGVVCGPARSEPRGVPRMRSPGLIGVVKGSAHGLASTWRWLGGGEPVPPGPVSATRCGLGEAPSKRGGQAAAFVAPLDPDRGRIGVAKRRSSFPRPSADLIYQPDFPGMGRASHWAIPVQQFKDAPIAKGSRSNPLCTPRTPARDKFGRVSGTISHQQPRGRPRVRMWH